MTWLSFLRGCVIMVSSRGWVCLRHPRFSSGCHGQELQCWVPLLHVFNPAKQVNMTRWVLLYHILYIVRLQRLLELPSSYKVLHLQYYTEWKETNRTSNWILIVWCHLSETRLASMNENNCIKFYSKWKRCVLKTWILKGGFYYRSETEQELGDQEMMGWPVIVMVQYGDYITLDGRMKDEFQRNWKGVAGA